MNQSQAHCPNCSEEIKTGLLGSNKLFNKQKTAIINEYQNKKADAYCNKCGKDLLNQSRKTLSDERDQLRTTVRQLIHYVPVISAHTPLGWEYTVIGMVTGQSVTGTGVLTEFTSSITDLFGDQSGRHNKKIKGGESLCFAQLRKQTIDAGGNAVLATDIDYSEVGAEKGMLMVCMAGTAVRLKNPDVLSKTHSESMEKLVTANDRLQYLRNFKVEEF